MPSAESLEDRDGCYQSRRVSLYQTTAIGNAGVWNLASFQHSPKRLEDNMGLGRSKTVKALGLTLLMFGCDNSGRTPISPTTPTPTATPAPTLPPSANNVLSGVIFEVTATGRTALEGATVQLLTCGAPNCPSALSAAHEVKTGTDGSYRIAGVYNGDLNFLWVRDDVYELVDPMAPGTCPDWCDRVVMVDGDTQLDIDLVRR
jgi:hypothetical protein